MSKKIKAIIVNRNLLTTLQNTVEFLAKEPRVEIVIYDQQSTYPLLLEYYKTQNVIYNTENGGPHSAWGIPNMNNGYYIVADSDCIYDGVPEDWLDRMLEVLNSTKYEKVGFSLRLDDLPNNEFTTQVKNHESQFWVNKCKEGWVADLDTTFSLYKPNSGFTYQAIRLPEPYTIQHVPWYLDENMSDEWKYYLKNASGVSTWGSRLKQIHNI
jgi:hypothetical protein